MAEASDFSSPSVNGVTEADKIKLRYATYRGWNRKELALKLAIAGFLCTGIGDKVKCETCSLQVDNWLPSYDAIETHRKRSPNCFYINKWFGGKNQTTSEASRNNVETTIPPKYPSYENYQKRLDSYFGWPLKYAHQSPSSMAAEGFFYLGSADRARCFQCGITLRDWDEDDRPLEAHVTWSPDCQFAQQRQELARRGGSSNCDERKPEFNRTEIKKNKEQHSERKPDTVCDGGNTNRNESSVEVRTITDVSNNVTDTEGAVGGVGNDDDVMSGVRSTMIDAVLEFGCSIESVRKAIQLERQRNGRDFPDAESLFAAILDIEESCQLNKIT